MKAEPYTGVNDPRINDIADEENLREATSEEQDAAYDQYGSEDIQIDENAKVSEIEGSKNIWVQAWVYVRRDA